MKYAITLALSLSSISFASLISGCADVEEDGVDEIGLDAGKSDGQAYSDCEKAAVVAYLNGGVTAEQLRDIGLGRRASSGLVKTRDGADGQFGTADDKPFADIAAVDAVAYVGISSIAALVQAAAPNGCEEPAPADVFAAARDVSQRFIEFPADAMAPDAYTRPDGGPFSLGGTEFWQKFEGGQSPTFSYGDGTNNGKLCMQASAIRFGEIMKNPPADMVTLLASSNWRGSFFNWNDDYTGASYDGGSSRLWAWKTHLIKWISVTHKDGRCELPTIEMVQAAAADCLETAASSDKEIQGCSAR